MTRKLPPVSKGRTVTVEENRKIRHRSVRRSSMPPDVSYLDAKPPIRRRKEIGPPSVRAAGRANRGRARQERAVVTADLDS
jgi:hypothetical protein